MTRIALQSHIFLLPEQLFSSNSAHQLLFNNAQARKTPQGYLLKISCFEKLQPLKKWLLRKNNIAALKR